VKLKGFGWTAPVVSRPPPKPTAAVVHRRRGRVVLRHGADETCDICQDVAAKAAAAPPRLHTDNSKSGWIDYQVPPQEERAPFTVWSRRAYHSKSLDDVLSMPARVFAAKERNRRQ
jgi:hypothetical protein